MVSRFGTKQRLLATIGIYLCFFIIELASKPSKKPLKKSPLTFGFSCAANRKLSSYR